MSSCEAVLERAKALWRTPRLHPETVPPATWRSSIALGEFLSDLIERSSPDVIVREELGLCRGAGVVDVLPLPSQQSQRSMDSPTASSQNTACLVLKQSNAIYVYWAPCTWNALCIGAE